MNYVWPEVHGNLEASIFTSFYIEYLTTIVVRNPSCTKIIIWSDGCTYQNRCNILSSALLKYAIVHNVTIQHKYLEVGHNHLEYDSVHSATEKAKGGTKG